MGKLAKFRSLCSERQAKIVSQDRESRNPCKHTTVNKNRSRVAQYQLDGQVFTGHEQRCDFLVMNQDKNSVEREDGEEKRHCGSYPQREAV